MKKLAGTLFWLAVFFALVAVFGLKTRRQALREALRPAPPAPRPVEWEVRTRRADDTRVHRRFREAERGRVLPPPAAPAGR